MLRPLIPGAAGEVEARLASLREYTRLLLEWNQGVSNLISRHDETRIVERHLFESLQPAQRIMRSGVRRLVDFGSGAGLPAVPLTLVGVGEHWTLVEARRNKTLFLRKTKQDLKLTNFEVVTGRLEMLVGDSPVELRCDGFTSRATMTLGPTLELASRIVASGGQAFLWKGSRHKEELDSERGDWSADWDLVAIDPIGDGPNVVVVMSRK